ncbi:MAG: HAMP domain-containing histidine kinase [Gammaproteobacteria bacterium]|nr:HAMP domain-containing histidine kinase [Gammaproteobacteria bacterium]
MNRILTALRRSLFARLMLIFLVTAMALGALKQISDALVEEERPYRQLVRGHLRTYVDYLLGELGTPPDRARARALTRDAPLDIRVDGPAGTWTSHPEFPQIADLDFDDQGHARTWRHKPRYYVRSERDGYTVVFATPPFDHDFAFAPARHYMLFGSLIILLLCYLAVRRLFSPIRLLHDGVQRIGAGELEYRVPANRSDELGELASAVNTMAGDVGQMLESKRQLLFAISHELRSPITRARLALELLDVADTRSLRDDLDEMERIVADLLEGERLSSRHSVLQREPCDLAALIEDVLQEDFSAQHGRFTLSVDGRIPALLLDVTRMKLLLRNLLRNALVYGGEENVEVYLHAAGEGVTLQISDHGEGIPAQHIDKVSEPFYRVDSSRNRGSGGIGLGLYLCRRIAEVHGGSLAINSVQGEGTTVEVKLTP